MFIKIIFRPDPRNSRSRNGDPRRCSRCPPGKKKPEKTGILIVFEQISRNINETTWWFRTKSRVFSHKHTMHQGEIKKDISKT